MSRETAFWGHGAVGWTHAHVGACVCACTANLGCLIYREEGTSVGNFFRQRECLWHILWIANWHRRARPRPAGAFPGPGLYKRGSRAASFFFVFFFYLLQVSALASLKGGALCKGDNSFFFVLTLVGILSQPQKLELCTCVRACVCTQEHTRVHACACARGQPQGFFRGFETGSHWPGACWFRKVDCPVSPKDLSVSATTALGLRVHFIMYRFFCEF